MFCSNLCRKLPILTKQGGPSIVSPIWSRPITSQTLVCPWFGGTGIRNSSTIMTCCHSFGIAWRTDAPSKLTFNLTCWGDLSSNDCKLSLFIWVVTPNLVNFGQVLLVCFGVPQVFKHTVHPFGVFSFWMSEAVSGRTVDVCLLLVLENSLTKLGFLFVPTAPKTNKKQTMGD